MHVFWYWYIDGAEVAVGWNYIDSSFIRIREVVHVFSSSSAIGQTIPPRRVLFFFDVEIPLKNYYVS